jgi:hypothetical protein
MGVSSMQPFILKRTSQFATVVTRYKRINALCPVYARMSFDAIKVCIARASSLFWMQVASLPTL